MIRVLNNFLNSFENFCWRLLIAIFFIIAVPIVAIPFVFGFFSVELKQKNLKNNE